MSKPSSFFIKNIFQAFLIGIIITSCAFAEDTIAYSHLGSDGYWQIWTMAPDGTNQKQVTNSPQDKREPAWSRGGERVAFRNTNGQLFVAGSDGKNETEILSGFKNISNPFFSSQHDEILFVRFDPRMQDVSSIWKSDIGGKDAKILMQATRRQYQPALSFDGDKIAFVKADTKREHHIWLMDTDGKNSLQLTAGAFFDVFPAFSPDNKTIAFSSNREDNNYEIYTVDIKTKNLKRLTRDPAFDSRPCFSPDGSKIIFTSSRGGQQEIWVMNTDGTSPAELTKGGNGVESIEPAWGNFSNTKEPSK